MEAVRGILGGTVPDLTLASLVADDPPPGGPPDALLQALESMLDSLPRTSTRVPEVECPLCGTSTAGSTQVCQGCGGRLRLTSQVWEV